MTVGRFPVVVFVLISVAGLLAGTQGLLVPLDLLAMFDSVAGVDIAAIAARDPQAARALDFLGRWIGTALWGSDGITLVLTLTSYRRGDRGAWIAFWYWPLMFASHAWLYEVGTPLWYVQFVNLGLSVAAQVVAWRRMRAAAAVP